MEGISRAVGLDLDLGLIVASDVPSALSYSLKGLEWAAVSVCLSALGVSLLDWAVACPVTHMERREGGNRFCWSH